MNAFSEIRPKQAGALSIDDKLLSGDSDAKEKAAVGIYVMKNGCM